MRPPPQLRESPILIHTAGGPLFMRLFAVALLITLPWLNPFSPGPSAAAVPLLFAWACAAGLLLAKAGDSGTTTTRADWVRAMALAWLAAAGLSAVIGLLQYFGATGWLGVWVNNTSAGEAYGNLRQRNQFASLLNIGFAALVWWVTQMAHKDTGRHFGQIGLALTQAVLLAASAMMLNRPARRVCWCFMMQSFRLLMGSIEPLSCKPRMSAMAGFVTLCDKTRS